MPSMQVSGPVSRPNVSLNPSPTPSAPLQISNQTLQDARNLVGNIGATVGASVGAAAGSQLAQQLTNQYIHQVAQGLGLPPSAMNTIRQAASVAGVIGGAVVGQHLGRAAATNGFAAVGQAAVNAGILKVT